MREAFTVTSTDAGSACVAYRERLPAGKKLANTDGGVDVIYLGTEELIWADAHIDNERWRPSIHMPRWASRILLEITEVRVERLNEISEADCIAEGVNLLNTNCDGECGSTPCGISRQPYISLWESINAVDSWKSNPWVWVVSFKVVKP